MKLYLWQAGVGARGGSCITGKWFSKAPYCRESAHTHQESICTRYKGFRLALMADPCWTEYEDGAKEEV